MAYQYPVQAGYQYHAPRPYPQYPAQYANPHPQPAMPAKPEAGVLRHPYDLAKMFDDYYRRNNFYPSPRSPHTPDIESLVMRRPRRLRTTFTSEQLKGLEEEFKISPYLTVLRLDNMSTKLYLTYQQIKIWFKNRRRKVKIEEEKLKELTSSLPVDLNVSLNGGLDGSFSMSEPIPDTAAPSKPSPNESTELPPTPSTVSSSSPKPSECSTPSSDSDYYASESVANFNHFDYTQQNCNQYNQYSSYYQQYPRGQYYQTPPASSNDQTFEYPLKSEHQRTAAVTKAARTCKEKMLELGKNLTINTGASHFAGLSPYEPLTPRTDTSPNEIAPVASKVHDQVVSDYDYDGSSPGAECQELYNDCYRYQYQYPTNNYSYY